MRASEEVWIGFCLNGYDVINHKWMLIGSKRRYVRQMIRETNDTETLCWKQKHQLDVTGQDSNPRPRHHGAQGLTHNN